MQFLFFKKLIFYYLPLLFWSMLIFALSSISGNGIQSYNLRTLLERKGAHVFEYAVLAILFARVFWIYHKDEENRSYYWAIFATFIFAVSDEIHQTFVFGRSGKATDLLIDFVGIVIGVAAYCYLHEKRKEKVLSSNKKTSR